MVGNDDSDNWSVIIKDTLRCTLKLKQLDMHMFS